MLFQLEMPSNHSLEAFGRILYIFKHCKFDVAIADDIGVSFILFLPLEGALFVLKSGLIEVNILAHDDGLD